ncbi:hypothetical protein [Natrinema gari]|uniref:hypothetical protein n=1 Tax=Natrinema gari TaxID=419186 RepID=UPI00126940A2|nr:hypothetical protein [Natrinema gari]
MLSRHNLLTVLIFSTGLVLILSTSYFYPEGGGDRKMTYNVEKIENESMAEAALMLSDQTLTCPGARECVFEEEVHEEGPLKYNGQIDRGPSYPVVQIEGITYIPKHNISGNNTEFTLQEISAINAIEYAAIPVEDQSSEVQKAVKTGSVTVYDKEVQSFEQGDILEFENEYYYKTGKQSQPTSWVAGSGTTIVRSAICIAGGLLIFLAGKRA